MSKELVVSSTRHETRVALVEDDQVVELYYQREKEYSLAGSIHKGRVTRVLPGMQSAFVDIGLERDAFLYVSDFFEDNDEYDKVVSSVEDKVLKLDKGNGVALAVVPPAADPAAIEPAAAAENAPPSDDQPVAAAPEPRTEFRGPKAIVGPKATIAATAAGIARGAGVPGVGVAAFPSPSTSHPARALSLRLLRSPRQAKPMRSSRFCLANRSPSMAMPKTFQLPAPLRTNRKHPPTSSQTSPPSRN